MDGYKFWHERLNSAKFILAPMVDQSELAWRMLSRKYGAQLCYTPMLHASIFLRDPTYRKENFTTCPEDRPLIVQFCTDNPETFCNAALLVENECDAVDLNLGCPQGIAKRGHYGSFLQDEWDLIYEIISNAVKKLRIPVTAKIRIFEDVEKTVRYAQMLEKAGVSILTVHGRTREQKGEYTGLADWNQIKAVKENVKIPVFANGNILYLRNVHECIAKTGCDGVMIAEGSLQNPALFMDKHPSVWEMCREYLMFVEKYACPLTWVRGHIFKMCRKIFDIHSDFREKLAKAKKMEFILKVIDEIEETCKNYTDQEESGLKYWQCQPYLRNIKEARGVCTEKEIETDKNKMLNGCIESSISEVRKQREKRKLEKLIRKNELCKKANIIKKAKYEACIMCSNPKSITCDHNACKKCCNKKVIEENLTCKGHKFKKKKDLQINK